MTATKHQTQVDRDWETSQQLIDDHVVPYLADCLNGNIISVDKGRSDLDAMLDRQAGIDALISYHSLVYGIALRVARGDWNTFTIRWRRATGLDTEFQKHARAQAAGSLTPFITAQAYIEGDRLTVGVAHLGKLYEWVQENLKDEWLIQRKNSPDNNRFLIVRWHHLENYNWFRKFETNLGEGA